jgi:hypothetical protein
LTWIKLDGGHVAVRDQCASRWHPRQGLARLDDQATYIVFGVDRHQIAARVAGLRFVVITRHRGLLRARSLKTRTASDKGQPGYRVVCSQMEESMKITLSTPDSRLRVRAEASKRAAD